MDGVTARTVFCEDVRLEVTGKFLLIGVYGGFIRVEAPNAPLRLSTWIEIFGLKTGAHHLALKVLLGDGTQFREISHLDLEVTVNDETLPTIIFPGNLTFFVEKNEELRLVMSIDDGDLVNTGMIKVFIQEPAQALPSS